MAVEEAGTGPLILVVEDNPANRLLMRALLRRAGYRPAEAQSLAEARTYLGSAHPALVVLDVGLPDGNGLDLLAQLKGRAIPALAVTANAMPGEAERAAQAGCAGYLTKPIDTRTFAASVADVLSQVRRESQGG